MPLTPRLVHAAIAAIAAAAVAAALAAPAPAYKAKIRETSYGIPHIKADNYGSAGYGVGFAFAKQNICTFANNNVTTSARRSKFFGSDGETPGERRRPGQQPRLRLLLAVGDRLRADRAPAEGEGRPKPLQGRQGGDPRLRRRLQRLPEEGRRRRHPRPALPRREVGQADRGDRRLAADLSGRPARQRPELHLRLRRRTTAEPDARLRPRSRPARPPRRSAAPNSTSTTTTPTPPSMGSNALGVGSEDSQNGHGLVLANPHFPWQGIDRFWELHLTDPRRVERRSARA